jgi:predicted AlkP superfamily pyrophosphatase or phosphodiesterase
VPAQKGLVLVLIDGLTPSVFERAVETGEAPALSYLARHGRYARAISTFPSLTPVCASSIATGAHPDVHHIPHLVWFDRVRGASSSTARPSARSSPRAPAARSSTRSST